MALDYINQAMGFGPYAFETEEERRKREEAMANQEVKTQTVKTYADGTQEVVNKQQIPAPVSPDQVFNRQIQVESGGQHYAPNGQILTSPAGAVGVAQIMPSTAANPGFGIKPITPDELATPEGNQAFGLRYKQGMLDAFGGDQEKATAAYNAGPGRVQQAVATAAQQGGSWKDYLPKETQNYLQKVLGGALNAIVPSAQAATPVAPDQTPARLVPPGQTVNLANSSQNIPAGGPVAPVAPTTTTPPANQAVPEQFNVQPSAEPMGPPVTAMTQESWSATQPLAQSFIDAKTPQDLNRIAGDPTAPKWAQDLANKKLYEQMRGATERENTTNKIADALAKNDNLAIAKLFQDKRGEGSWAKAILFGYMGAPQLAAQELGKMGYGTTFQQSTLDGKPVLLEMRYDGLPQQGIDLTTGNKLTDLQLGQAVTGFVGVKGAHTESGLVDNSTGVGGYIRTTTPDGRQIVKDASGKLVTDTNIISNLRKVGVEGTRAEQDESLRVKAAYANLAKNYTVPTDQQKYQALVDAGVPPKRIEAELGLKPGTLTGARTTAVPAPATTSSVTAANTTQQIVQQPKQADLVYEEPVQRPGESNVAFKARVEERNKKLNLMSKNAEDFRTKSDDIKNQLQSIKEIYDVIDRGEYNLGPTLGGGGAAGPVPGVQQFFGELVGTEESQNTAKILSLINREGLQGIKNSMGPAISNFDVQAWMASNPIKPNASQAALKDYVAKLYKEIYDKSERSRENAVRLGMIESDFNLGTRPEDIRTTKKSKDDEVDRDNPLLKKKKK